MSHTTDPGRLRRLLRWLGREGAPEPALPLEVPGSLSQVLQDAVEVLAPLLEERRQSIHAVIGHRFDTQWMTEELEGWMGRSVAWALAQTPEDGRLELRTFETAGRIVVKLWSAGPARAIGDSRPPAPAGVEVWTELAPAAGLGFSFESRRVRLEGGL